MTTGKKIVLGFLAAFVVILGVVGGWAYHLASVAVGTKDHPAGPIATFTGVRQIMGDPRQGFPDKDKINILCMGIDDNWTDGHQLYTHNARTDTLFLLTLDLANQRASMLSIPRDSFTHIAGTGYSDKINSAYATGGPTRSIATVAEMTGVHADHYLVLNIDATKKMVAALGGVDLNVEHQMDYDDNWGYLHVHLMPGFQHLDANQAVGFARYRHGDPGARPSPEDGDERRMYRQHVLLRAMIAKAKTFGAISNSSSLFQTAMDTIHTDLTQTQMLDLASIYKDMPPDSIRTASLPGTDFRGPGGAWDYQLDPVQMKAYVDWMVRDDPAAIDHLSTIIVKNGTAVPGLAKAVVAKLKSEGYTDVIDGGNAPSPTVHLTASSPSGLPRTMILDTGVPDQTVPNTLAQDLGVSAVLGRHPVKPNHLGWTPPPSITISLGQDYAAVAQNGSPSAAPTGTTTN